MALFIIIIFVFKPWRLEEKNRERMTERQGGMTEIEQ
jgi:hypothetical protein